MYRATGAAPTLMITEGVLMYLSAATVEVLSVEAWQESSTAQWISDVSIGAVLGANLRYFISQYLSKFAPAGVPLGTLVVNVTGSFVLGFFLIWTSERVLADPRWRLFVAIGFCGGYTTFSSFAYETFALFEHGQLGPTIWNLLLNNVLCLSAVVAGAAIARIL
jgi:CrcB protein